MQTLQKLQLSNRLYIEQVTCHLYLRELVQRPQSRTQSVWKYLLIGARLLWKPVNRFVLQIG